MFKLTKDHSLPKMWASFVIKGVYTIEQVPTMFNLRVATQEVLDEIMAGMEA